MTATFLTSLGIATLAATAAMLLVLWVRPIIRRHFGPRVSYALWVIVPVATLVSLLPSREIVTVETLAPIVSEPQAQTLDSTLIPSASPASVPPFTSTSAPADTGFTMPDIATILLAVWAIGALFMLARLIYRQRSFMKAHAAGSARLQVANADDVGPVAVGIVKSRIIVPADFKTRYSKLERKLIVAHERAHITSGDMRYNLIAALIDVVFWFNPLVKFAVQRFRMDQELACDARVMKRHGTHRRVYGEALLKTQFSGEAAPLACAWSSKALKARLEGLSEAAPGPFKNMLGGILAALMISSAAAAAWAAFPEERTVYKSLTAVDEDDLTEAEKAELKEQVAALRQELVTAKKALAAAKSVEAQKREVERAAAVLERLEAVEHARALKSEYRVTENHQRAQASGLKAKLASLTAQLRAYENLRDKDLDKAQQLEIEARIKDLKANLKEVELQFKELELSRDELREVYDNARRAAEEVDRRANERDRQLQRQSSNTQNSLNSNAYAFTNTAQNGSTIGARIITASSTVNANGVSRLDINGSEGDEKLYIEADEILLSPNAEEPSYINRLLSANSSFSLLSVGDETGDADEDDDRDNRRGNVTSRALGRALFEAVEDNDFDDIKELIDAGADVNYFVRGDGTPLIQAVRNGDEAIVTYLLEAGADATQYAPGDETPLLHAVEGGDRRLVELLLEAGADVNEHAPGDGTPLVIATKSSNITMARLLMELGADVNKPAPGDGNPLINAALKGHKGLVKLFLDAGADVNGYVKGDETPLINAAQGNRLDIAQMLIKAGADVNLSVDAGYTFKSPNKSVYRSPVGQAKRYGHDRMVKLLLNAGAEDVPKEEH